MKKAIQIFFSLFFFLAIGVHLYLLYTEAEKKIIYHAAYLLTYGGCWGALLSPAIINRLKIYFIMMLFPWLAHLYYTGKHIAENNYDTMFGVCVVVSLLLPAGYLYMRHEINLRTEDV